MNAKLMGSLLLCLVLLNSVYINSADAASISLISHSGYIDLSDNYHVVGEVKNTGTQTHQFITITIDFYDTQDDLIASRFDLTLLDVLLPGRKTPFNVMLLDQTLSANVDGYAISIAQSDRNPLPQGMEIISHESYEDEIGDLHVLGSIKNVASQPTENIKVVATFYDNDGNVVAASFGYIDDDETPLQPGGTRNFEIILDSDRVPYAKNYTLTAESTQYALISDEPEPEPQPEPEPEPQPEPEPEPEPIPETNLSPPTFFSPQPANASTKISPNIKSLNVTINDEDADNLNVSIFTVPDIGQLTLTNVTSGTYSLKLQNNLDWESKYEWLINAFDGKHWTNSTYYFTTEEEPKPPVIGSINPIDGSENVSIKISALDFTIYDLNGDRMDYYVSLEPGPLFGNAILRNDGNYSVPIPYLLEYATSYRWWLNVTDNNQWTNASYTFRTEYPPQSEPEPEPETPENEQPNQATPIPGFTAIMFSLILITVILVIKLISIYK